MEIVINNKIRLKNVPSILQSLLIDKLVIDNPKFINAKKMGLSTWGVNKYITNFSVMPDQSLLVPRGIRVWLLQQVENLNIDYKITDERTLFNYVEIDSSKINLLPYQFDGIKKLVSSHSEGILVSPAGSGKTVVGLSIIPMTGQPTLWLTHTIPLADQVKERIKTFLPSIENIGMLGANKWIKGDILTVGVIQTLIRNKDQLIKMRNDWGLVILDEAHHCPARTFNDVVSILNPYYIYGLTATPYRRDKLEEIMFQTLGEETTTIPINVVEHHGGIIVPKVRYREIRSKKIDTNNIQQILKQIVSNTKRNRTIASDVITEAINNHFCIVISDRREHCETLYELISASWKKTGIATGKYNNNYIKDQVKRYVDGETTVLVTTFALLGEGFDVNFTDRAFICMPFRAESKAEQLIGRIQRTAPHKKDAIVYDYVDVDVGVLQHQFFNKTTDCRYRTYSRLGVSIEPYGDNI